MKNYLISLVLNDRRDLLGARQRSRQIAGLLGFGPPEQSLLAAEVFALLTQTETLPANGALHFRVAGRFLEIVVEQAAVLRRFRFSVPLPPPAFAMDDLKWMAQELDARTPANLFEELRRLDAEFLQAYRALHHGRAGLETAA